MVPRLCPHCQTTLPTSEMVDHIDRKCPNLKIECPFRHFGCSVSVQRQVEISDLNSFQCALNINELGIGRPSQCICCRPFEGTKWSWFEIFSYIIP